MSATATTWRRRWRTPARCSASTSTSRALSRISCRTRSCSRRPAWRATARGCVCSARRRTPSPGRPDSPALLFKGATVSYGELDRLSDACASAFAALGITRGDRVGLLLPNCPQFFIAQFGAWKIGAIVAPLNPIYTEHELEGPLRDHGIETVLTLTRFYQRVKNVQAKTGVRRVIATNIKEFFPPHLRVLFTLFRETRDGDRITLKPGDHDFAHLLLVNRGRKPAAAAPIAADPPVLLMSR